MQGDDIVAVLLENEIAEAIGLFKVICLKCGDCLTQRLGQIVTGLLWRRVRVLQWSDAALVTPNSDIIGFGWRALRDSNPCYRRERAVS